MQYLLAGGSAFLLSIFFTFFIRNMAWRFQILDKPGFWRKIHSHPIPLLGGTAIFLSFLSVSLFFVFFTNNIISKYVSEFMMLGIWISGLIIMLGGFLDDKKILIL